MNNMDWETLSGRLIDRHRYVMQFLCWLEDRRIVKAGSQDNIICYYVGNELIEDDLRDHPSELFVAKVELALKFAPRMEKRAGLSEWPTSDPHVNGAVWNNGGVLTISISGGEKK